MCNCNSSVPFANVTLYCGCGCDDSISSNLELVDDGFGVVDGSDILGVLKLNDISIPVTEYQQNTFVLSSNQFKVIPSNDFTHFLVRNIYSSDAVNIADRQLIMTMQKYNRNPINGNISPSPSQLDVNYTLPTGSFTINTLPIIDDIISIGNIQLIADIDFAIGLDINTTITNIVNAINNHAELQTHITATNNNPNITITANFPYNSYKLIELEYLPNTSLNVATTPNLESTTVINDDILIVNEFYLLSSNTNTPLNNIILYNYTGYDVQINMLQVK